MEVEVSAVCDTYVDKRHIVYDESVISDVTELIDSSNSTRNNKRCVNVDKHENVSENTADSCDIIQINDESYYINIDDCCLEYSISDLENVNLNESILSSGRSIDGSRLGFKNVTRELNVIDSSAIRRSDDNNLHLGNVAKKLHESTAITGNDNRVDNLEIRSGERILAKSPLSTQAEDVTSSKVEHLFKGFEKVVSSSAEGNNTDKLLPECVTETLNDVSILTVEPNTSNPKPGHFKRRTNTLLSSARIKSPKNAINEPLLPTAKRHKVSSIVPESIKRKLSVKEGANHQHESYKRMLNEPVSSTVTGDDLANSELNSCNKRLKECISATTINSNIHNCLELRVLMEDILENKESAEKTRNYAKIYCYKQNKQVNGGSNSSIKRETIPNEDINTKNKKIRILKEHIPNKDEKKQDLTNATLGKKQRKCYRNKYNYNLTKQITLADNDSETVIATGQIECKEEKCLKQNTTVNNISLEKKYYTRNSVSSEKTANIFFKKNNMRTVNATVLNETGNLSLKQRSFLKDVIPKNRISEAFGKKLLVKVVRIDNATMNSSLEKEAAVENVSSQQKKKFVNNSVTRSNIVNNSGMKETIVHKHRRRRQKKNVKLFQCTLCDFVTKFSSSLKRHFQCIHNRADQGWLVCNKCKYRTRSNDSLNTHIQNIHQKVEWFKCDKCPLKTKLKTFLISHKKLFHDKTYKPTTRRSCMELMSRAKVLKCRFCNLLACWDSVVK